MIALRLPVEGHRRLELGRLAAVMPQINKRPITPSSRPKAAGPLSTRTGRCRCIRERPLPPLKNGRSQPTVQLPKPVMSAIRDCAPKPAFQVKRPKIGHCVKQQKPYDFGCHHASSTNIAPPKDAESAPRHHGSPCCNRSRKSAALLSTPPSPPLPRLVVLRQCAIADALAF